MNRLQELSQIWSEYQAANEQFLADLRTPAGLGQETTRRYNAAVVAMNELDLEDVLRWLLPIALAAEELVHAPAQGFPADTIDRLAVSERLMHKLEDALEGLDE